jgi:Mg/Co/Ni transporter MgtE
VSKRKVHSWTNQDGPSVMCTSVDGLGRGYPRLDVYRSPSPPHIGLPRRTLPHVTDENVSPDTVHTVRDLAKALKYARSQAGFDTATRFAKETDFPRSTAYSVEEGTKKPAWATVETYLDACEITDLRPWKAAHRRATNESVAVAPTATQMAEMGAELAAATLSEIERSQAADLIRTIALDQAVEVVPKIDPNVAIEILDATSRTRRILIFERIDSARGAELLAEMTDNSMVGLLTELHDAQAAELVAKLPRRLAERTLKTLLEPDRTLDLLAEMQSEDAIKFLPRLGFELTAQVVSTATTEKAALLLSSLDTGVAKTIFTDITDEPTASRILWEMSDSAAATILMGMDHKHADKLIRELPAENLSNILQHFDSLRQTEILSNVIDLSTALEWFREPVDYDQDDGYLIRSLIERISMPRFTDMIGAAESDEKVLLLALSGTRQESILSSLSENEAAQMRQHLSIPQIAASLERVGPERAYSYMRALHEDPPTLLSHMTHEAALSILYRFGSLGTIGKHLDFMSPEMTASAFKSSHGFEAAGFVSSMRPEHVLAAFRLLDKFTVYRILDAIDERVERNQSHADRESRDPTRRGATSTLRTLYETDTGEKQD